MYSGRFLKIYSAIASELGKFGESFGSIFKTNMIYNMNQWTHCENLREIPENKPKSLKQEIHPKVRCDRESHCSDNPVRLSELLPPATKLGQGYVFTRVCDSVHRGFYLSACWDTRPRAGRHLPPRVRQTPLPPGQADTL